MDPATAIGTASAILSFIEFSWKLVAGANEIYRSVDRTSEENSKIRDEIHKLQSVTEDLETRHLGNSKPEKVLKDLRSECNKLSEELMGTLRKLQGNGSFLRALKVTLKSMYKKNDISSVQGRLARYTSQIIMVLNTMLL